MSKFNTLPEEQQLYLRAARLVRKEGMESYGPDSFAPVNFVQARYKAFGADIMKFSAANNSLLEAGLIEKAPEPSNVYSIRLTKNGLKTLKTSP